MIEIFEFLEQFVWLIVGLIVTIVMACWYVNIFFPLNDFFSRMWTGVVNRFQKKKVVIRCKCGEENWGHSKFCSNCGAKL